MTVMKYIPSCPTIAAKSGTSNTFPITKKDTPNGDNLNARFDQNRLLSFKFFKFAYQITQDVMIIIASLSAIKKSNKGFPFDCIFPMVTPKITLNITTPKTLVESVGSFLNFNVVRSSAITINITILT